MTTKRHMFEARDGSAVRVLPAPWPLEFRQGFMRAAHPSGQLKLFSASAVERSRGRLFFGDFLLAKQKKDTPAAGKHARRAGENYLKKQNQRASQKARPG